MQIFQVVKGLVIYDQQITAQNGKRSREYTPYAVLRAFAAKL